MAFIYKTKSNKLSWLLTFSAVEVRKYMLNVVNASRLFYPDQADATHQWLPELKDLTPRNSRL